MTIVKHAHKAIFVQTLHESGAIQYWKGLIGGNGEAYFGD